MQVHTYINTHTYYTYFATITMHESCIKVPL